MKMFVVLKKNIIPILFILFVVLLVVFSNSTFSATKAGLVLWANNVVPSLFPFLVAVELLNHTNVVYYLSIILDKYMRPLFNLPGISAFPFVMGFLSGYPVGAKIVSDLYDSGTCTKDEAERMLSFTNNSGPLFIIGTVGISFYANSTIGIILLVTHILASITVGILGGFLSKFLVKKETNAHNYDTLRGFSYSNTARSYGNFEQSTKANGKNVLNNSRYGASNNVNFSELGEILGSSIMSSIKTVLIIGGFVTLFSVITTLLEKTNFILIFANIISSVFNVDANLISSFVTGIIEFTNGLSKLSSIHIKNISTNIVLSAIIIGFGGISVALQVLSIISKHHLSVKKYLIGKLVQAGLAGVYTYLILLVPIFNFNL